jgi:hypothetical protein
LRRLRRFEEFLEVTRAEFPHVNGSEELRVDASERAGKLSSDHTAARTPQFPDIMNLRSKLLSQNSEREVEKSFNIEL